MWYRVVISKCEITQNEKFIDIKWLSFSFEENRIKRSMKKEEFFEKFKNIKFSKKEEVMWIIASKTESDYGYEEYDVIEYIYKTKEEALAKAAELLGVENE